MTTQLVDRGWGKRFTEALCDDASELRIICPFIKVRALERLLNYKPGNVQFITRFNLVEFAEGASDVAALRMLLDTGARVRGVLNLHAKLYIFGKSRAIITSCNLTEAALFRNHEFGMIIEDKATIGQCLDYFDGLWHLANSDLLRDQVDAWDSIITSHWLRGGRQNETSGLHDLGVDIGLGDAPSAQVPIVVADAPQAFVKILGMGNNRVPLSASTIEEVRRGGSHWAACYPANRRPRGVKDGAVIFMGRLTNDPNDIRVFGRAIGMAYREGRDDASQTDIELRHWKERWSRYIRVHHADFVAGTMENGVSLNELMESLKANSFASTQRNAARGNGNTNPRHAYRQQAAVELSSEGFSWLSNRLEAAFESHGKVSRNILDKLDWPDSPIIPSPSH